MSKTSGTKEWADHNVNCVDGCTHDCKYCYARQMANRFDRPSGASWKTMIVREKDVSKAYRKRKGRIMFPTAHDLVPTDPSFAPCMVVLGKLLAAGNEVLVTTKPHLAAIQHICNTMEQYKGQIQFRFTITSMDDAVLAEWEAGAPRFEERYRSLEYAFLSGFKTSVSIEPVLDNSLEALDSLYSMVSPWCTESCWLGIMNHVKGGIKIDAGSIYRHFVHRDRIVRFKDSIRKAVGVD
jgi:DNA repair photolyase